MSTTMIIVIIVAAIVVAAIAYFMSKSNYTIYRAPPAMNLKVDTTKLDSGKEGYTPELGSDSSGDFEGVDPIIPYQAARNPTTIHRPLEPQWPGRKSRSDLLISAQANPSLGFGMGANPFLDYMRDEQAVSAAVNSVIT